MENGSIIVSLSHSKNVETILVGFDNGFSVYFDAHHAKNLYLGKRMFKRVEPTSRIYNTTNEYYVEDDQ